MQDVLPISIHTYIPSSMHSSFKHLETWTLLTIATSIVSLLITMTTTFSNMPHLTEKGLVLPFQHWKNHLIVGPVMAILVTPRLLILSIFFATIRYMPCAVIICCAMVLYSIAFWITAKFKYFKKQETNNDMEPENR